MRFKSLIYSLFFSLVVSGCATTPFLFTGTDIEGNPICLTDCSEIPASIEAYRTKYDLITEENKIDYLLSRAFNAPQTFIRNKTKFNGEQASQFMRWKIRWYEKHFREEIITDDDFVYKVLRRAENTGRKYEVIMEDGLHHDLKFVMLNELNAMDAYLSLSDNS